MGTLEADNLMRGNVRIPSGPEVIENLTLRPNNISYATNEFFLAIRGGPYMNP